MNRIRHIMTCILCLGAMLEGMAQDYDAVRRRNLWNGTANIAGIRKDTLDRGEAKASVNNENRDLIISGEAKHKVSAGVEAASIIHLQKFSLDGKLGFRHEEQFAACGNMSARPGYFPISFYEFTPGRKTRQTYDIDGTIAADISQKLTIGAGIDYTAENYTKRKDLRHTNYLLDMKFSAGAIWHGENRSLGLSYSFAKIAETITAEELGISSGTYIAFIDKGYGFGTRGRWDNSGLHLKESGVSGSPIKEYSHSIAFQMQEKNGTIIEAIAGIDKGQSGEKQKIWYDFGGYRFGLHAAHKWDGPSADNYLKARLDIRTQTNDENVLVEETSGGVTTTHIYGSNRVLSREWVTAGLDCERISHDGEYLFTRFTYRHETGLASVHYPFLYGVNIDEVKFHTGVMKRIGKSIEIRFDFILNKGWLKESKRTIELAPRPSKRPDNLYEYQHWIMDYRLNLKRRADLEARYVFKNGIYVGLQAGYLLSYFNGYSVFESIRIGYSF